MVRAFLSHSSQDKESYVRPLAQRLDKSNIVYDEFTFEEGGKTLDEILRGIEDAELFVLLISNSALDSQWVQREVSLAKTHLDESQIRRIYPIIIDDKVTYKDPRIPEWLRINYNLKPVKKVSVAADRITNKLREISWSKYPALQMRQTIFVGRNDKLEEFEARIYDFEKDKPLAIVASGFPGIGRRTFLHHALVKTDFTELSHVPAAIYVDRNTSVEDFILKLNDLGMLDLSQDVYDLATRPVEKKLAIIQRFMANLQDSKELVYIVDDGCLVNYKREVSPWFVDTISSFTGSRSPIFCLASRYNVHFGSRPRNNQFLFMELNELNFKERERLFSKLLDIHGIDLSTSEFGQASGLMSGLPAQITFAVDLLREDNLSSFTSKLPTIANFNTERAAILLSQYDDDELTLKFIRLLAQFEVIAKNFVFQIVEEKTHYPILEELAAQNICELIGVDGEIIRLNDIVRDYIKRNRLHIEQEHADAVQRKVKEIVESGNFADTDSSIFAFSIKEALKTGIDVDSRYLIPSHYLTCMKDLYYSKRRPDKVVQLADTILQKEATLDPQVVQDIRYYLCLTLAKKCDSRLLQEVRNIKGDEHNFLLGFYYRQCGRFRDALDRFQGIVDAPYVGARCKREMVQVYVQLEEYEKALGYARRNYEENRDNQFHVQAYFNCLINSDDCTAHSATLQQLIEKLKDIGSSQSSEMAGIAQALFYAKVMNNRQSAIDAAEDCIASHPQSHYPILSLCDIALKYRDVDLLEKGVSLLEDFTTERHLGARLGRRQRAYLLALKGNPDEAKSILKEDLDRFPPDSKDRILARIDNYANTSGFML